MRKRIKAFAGLALAVAMLAVMAVPVFASGITETGLNHKVYVNGQDVFSGADDGFDAIASEDVSARGVTAIDLNGRDVDLSNVGDSLDAAPMVPVAEGDQAQGVVRFYKSLNTLHVQGVNLKQSVSVRITLGDGSAEPAPADKTDIVITTERNASYQAYRILNLTTALKPDCGHGGGEDHAAGCYTYAYTVNGKYEAAIKAGLAAAGIDVAADASNAALISAIAGMADKGDEIRGFAEGVYASIKTSGLAADETASNKTFPGVAQGYYLIVDVTDVSGAQDARGLVMLDTAGKESCSVTAKDSNTPSVTKRVEEKNDTTGDTGWGDAADHDQGDAVQFELIGTMPDNLADYTTYKYVFHDKMDAGLTFDPSSVAISVAGGTVDASLYEIKTEGLSDGCTFEIAFDDVKSVPGVTSASQVTVTYAATLNEGATVGGTGNKNAAHLEFSNDPYGTGTGKTPDDIVTVFTYKLRVDKVDAKGHALAGAAFELQKYVQGTGWQSVGREFTLDGTNQFNMSGLDAGRYKLIETRVPAGYNKAADVEFEVAATYDAEGVKTLDVKDPEGNAVEGFVATASAGSVVAAVVNVSGIRLPTTGGPGLVALYVLAGLAVAGGLVAYFGRRKRSEAK